MEKHQINIFKYFVIPLLLAVASSLHAKRFKVFDISNGLPNNTVKCIAQDREGFLWLGTFDGLCRFDGVNFTIFRNNPNDSLSIISNHVETIQPVDDGLWIGTLNGPMFYSTENGNFYSIRCAYPNGEERRMETSIKKIVQIGSRIFMQDQSHNLYVSANKHLTFSTYNDVIENPCLAVAPYKKDLLLVQTTRHLCIIRPDDAKIIGQTPMTDIASNDNVLYYSPANDIVYVGYGIGHESEAFRIRDDMSFERLDVPVPSDLKAAIDHDGKTLFGTDGKGLVEASDGKSEHFLPINSNISSDAVHALYVDSNQNLWLGTYRGGLNLCSGHFNRFHTLTVAEHQLTQGVVTAVLPQNDKLYIGQDGGGLNVYDKRTGKTDSYTTANSSIAGNHILSLSADRQYIWMGIYGKGICRFSPDSRSFKTFPLPDKEGKKELNHIWDIKDDGLGRLWVMGEDVLLFDKSTETFSVINELLNCGASGICFDNDIAWIGTTRRGIYKLDSRTGKILRHYSKESEETPIAENRVRYLYLDSQRRLWFSTNTSGLFKLDDSTRTVTPYTARQGLTARNVVSILEDKSGYYWMGTDNGLFRYTPQDDSFIRFGKEDDLPFVQFNYKSCHVENGICYFGAVGGLTWFTPQEIQCNLHANKVYFTNIELISQEKENIYLHGDRPEEIRLPYDQNFFTIHFSIPELISPDKVYFTYRMENFEQNWQEGTQVRKATYTNVPPGEYHFHVKASDNGSKWGENISCLKIIITPPWWKTNWAITLWCLLAVGILLVLFGLYRHELNIQHLVSLKEVEKNAVKTISEAKLNFFTNITHELRTPIFLITAPVEELLSSDKNPIQVPKSYLLGIYRNALRLNKLISRVIDFRKLESGKLKLEPQRLNVVNFCKELTADYEALCQQKNIQFCYQPSKTIIPLEFDPEKLESILSNLVSNAFKYTPEGGQITFSISETETNVELTVEDNGIGIDKQYHEAIFDGFFQVDPSMNSSISDGIGLSFVKHLVELHRGTVTVESQLGHGSKFICSLPKPATEEIEMQEKEVSVIADEPMPPSDHREQTVATVQSPAAMRSILIIDDEKETVEILERALVEDFRIWKADNGVDGLAIVQKELPDLIVCDVMMPQMDGMEFLSIVKHDKKLSHIPVIMFTAKSSEQDKMVAFDSGADAYLTKPISLKYLRKRIDHLLTRAESVEVVNMISKSEKKYTKEEQRFILKCKEIIDDNLANGNLDVVFLAEQLGMSHSSLYRKIKSVTGMSVIEFINEYRIFKAVQYFKEGETNISAVSVKCGFNDLKNFRDAFKRKMAVSPKQYVSQL